MILNAKIMKRRNEEVDQRIRCENVQNVSWSEARTFVYSNWICVLQDSEIGYVLTRLWAAMREHLVLTGCNLPLIREIRGKKDQSQV